MRHSYAPPKVGRLTILGLFFSAYSATFVALYCFYGPTPPALYTVALVVLLAVTKSAWATPAYHRSGVARLSLLLVGAFPVALVVRNDLLSLVLAAARELGVPLPRSAETSPLIIALVTVCYFGAIVLVNYFARDKTIASRHPNRLALFKESLFEEELDAFRRTLAVSLQHEDLATKWSEHYYEPIDSEVENSKKKSRLPSLVNALRHDRKSSLIVVIGEPGSGKSVALRRMAASMLEQSKKAERVPLYVNLRGWETRDDVDGPTATSLLAYVRRYVEEQTGDVHVKRFLDDYFETLYSSGHLFLLFDSFDEAPAILDADDSTEAVRRASHAISVVASRARDGRLVVASRPRRQPVLPTSTTQITLLPFSIRKAFEAVSRALPRQRQRIRQLFQNETMAAACRNPFIAGLVRNFLEHSHGMPETRLQLFESFVSQRIADSSEWLNKRAISGDEVLEGARAIAWEIYRDQTHGLDVTLTALPEGTDWGLVIEALLYMRIVRRDRSIVQTIAFCHRRFAEYFAAEYLRRNRELLRVGEIATDSRWRDMLVLYGEVLSPSLAGPLAEYAVRCASTSLAELTTSDGLLLTSKPDELRRLFSSVRFLADAFGARRDLVASWSQELGRMVSQLTRQSDRLYRRLAIHACPLLSEGDLEKVVSGGLENADRDIALDVMHQYRRIAAPSAGLRAEVFAWLSVQNYVWLRSMKRDLAFIFETAEDRLSRRFFLLYQADSVLLTCAVLALLWVLKANVDIADGIVLVLCMSVLLLIFDMIGWAAQCVARLGIVLSVTLGAVRASSWAMLWVCLALPLIPMMLVPWRTVLRRHRDAVLQVASAFIFVLMTRLWELLPGPLETILTYLFAAVGVFYALRNAGRYVRERRLVKALDVPATREDIESALERIQNVQNMMLLLRRVEDAKVVPVGEWSVPRKRSLRSPEVAERLGQLDEVWRGLV
jgi:hypothetical protein